MLDGLAHHDRITLEADGGAILRVLENCPDDLLELRATLVQEHVGRVRDGLA